MTAHQHLYPFCRVTYWKDNVSSTADEEWTQSKVTPLGAYSYGEQTFGNTEEEIYRRRALITFLQKAYELGRTAAKREIREVLGVKEER